MTRSATLLLVAMISALVLGGCGRKSEVPRTAQPERPATDPTQESDQLPPQTEPPISASADGVANADVGHDSSEQPPAFAAFDALCEAYARGNQAAFAGAEQQLLDLGPQAVPPAIEALQAGPTHQREIAADLLSKLQLDRDEVATALTAGLDDESVIVQAHCARTLSRFAVMTPELQDTLIRLLRMDDPEMNRVAMQIVSGMGPLAGPFVPEITELLENRDSSVRMSAALTLGGLGVAARPAMDRLKSAAQRDLEERVRKAASAALARIKTAEGQVLPAGSVSPKLDP